MSFLSAFTNFLGTPLFKTFTSGLHQLVKGNLKGDEFVSSLFDQLLELAPGAVSEVTKFIAPYISNIDKVKDTLKRAAKDLPELLNFEPLKVKKVKTQALDFNREEMGWRPLDIGGPINNIAGSLEDDIYNGRKSIRDLPYDSFQPAKYPGYGIQLPSIEPDYAFRPRFHANQFGGTSMGFA